MFDYRQMGLLAHLLDFLICSVLIIVVWFIFLFFNNLIDNIQRNLIQGLLGTVNTVTLMAALGVIIYYYALGFFTGALLTMILIFLIYSGKKALGDLKSARS